jgi:polyisoprenoid-binding protein YceI
MRLKLLPLLLSGVIAFGAITWSAIKSTGITAHSYSISATEITSAETGAGITNGVRYRLDPDQSNFIVDANSSGVLWFLGHNHHIAARQFTGEAQATPGTLAPASLRMTIKTESMAETGEHFTDQQKKIITGSMQKEVLETAKYPEAVFKSSNVTAKKMGENLYEAMIEGDLTLHGVTRRITIPAKITVEGDNLRASGKFEFDRDDFNIKTHSIKWGTIRVDDDMKLSFNIVAHKF